ncbi:hypothetical protein Tco_0770067 [Tanacetum coccineum]|uniref:Uncharacterized protein n=1 Tax=Tanacetum coccineum TaxID=301880 RepID=A0ABQ4ZD14_9ASTR
MLKEIVNRDVGDAYMEVSEDEEEFEIHTMIKMKMLILNSLYQIILLTATGTNVLNEASKSRTDEALGAKHGSTSHLAQNEWRDKLAFRAGIVSVKSAGQRVAASTVTVKPVELYKGIQLTPRFGVEPTFGEWAAAAHIDLIQLGRHLHYGEECRDKMIRSNNDLLFLLQEVIMVQRSARQAVQRSRAEQNRITPVPANAYEQAREKEWQQRMIDINSVLKFFTDSRPPL